MKKTILKNEGEMFDKILQWLAFEKEKRNIEFAHGIGKIKTKIQKSTEQLTEYKERQERYNL